VPGSEWFERVVEQATDLVVAFHPDGEIVYLNRAAEETLGVDRREVLGENFVEWIHPDDLERALEVVSLMGDGGFEETPVTPATYRVRCGDGSWMALEVNGAQLAEPDGSGDVVTICRYSGDRVLHDEILDRLTGGDSVEDVLALVPDLGHWRHPTERYAVAFTGDDGERHSVGNTLPAELSGEILEPGQPWAQALRLGKEVVVEADELDDDLRQLAAKEGLNACRVVPIADPTGDLGATITVWSTPTGPPITIHRFALDTMERVIALILRWRQQVRQLTRAALTDHLTGAASRSRFFAALDKPTPAAEGHLAAILYVDLDRFKPVNDEYGHSTGDEVLVEIAARIASVVRPSDLVARIGGDEFAVLCRDLGHIDEATIIADRVIEAVGRPVPVGAHLISVDASVGIATTLDDSIDGDALLESADAALYDAKSRGRGRWALAANASDAGS
jgi:diguanylate cyclase (GGDEF)-like protein/PAS domain S-box-containing protein